MSKPTGKLRGLVLQDYQSHKLTKLEIHPGITVVTGENLVGKSSILRAMRSVVNFDTMRIRTRARQEKTPCKVRLIFDDPLVVTRIRTEDANGKLVEQKLVVKDGEDKQEYTKLGQSLPTAVIEQLKMGEIQVDKSTVDLNFAGQHDPAFLIDPSFKGSLRIKMLGTVNDQVRFDQGLRIMKAEEKEHKSGLKAKTEALQDFEDRLAAAKAGPNLAAYKTAVEDALAKLEAIERVKALKEQYISRWEEHAEANEALRDFLAELPTPEAIDKLEMTIIGLDALREQIASKRLLVEKLSSTKKRVDELRAAVAVVVDFTAVEEHVVTLETLQRVITRKLDLHSQMQTRTVRIEGMTLQIKDLDEELADCQMSLETATKDGVICPFSSEMELQPVCRKKILEEGMDV